LRLLFHTHTYRNAIATTNAVAKLSNAIIITTTITCHPLTTIIATIIVATMVTRHEAFMKRTVALRLRGNDRDWEVSGCGFGCYGCYGCGY
jgi:hypothetical protein